MTTPKHANLDKLRLTKSVNYWWDVFIGGIITSMILIPIGGLFLTKLNLTSLFYPYLVLCILFVVYYQ